jgi:hypothetical protein
METLSIFANGLHKRRADTAEYGEPEMRERNQEPKDDGSEGRFCLMPASGRLL